MLYQTSYPVAAIDEQQIRDLVNQMSRISGQRIDIDTQIVVSTEDANLSAMLECLRDSIVENGPVAKVKPLKKGRTPKIKIKKLVETGPKPEPTRGPHVRSIKIIDETGEMISCFELNKRLADHTIEPGCIVHSPKYGNLTVRNGGGESEPYTLVTPAGEPV